MSEIEYKRIKRAYRDSKEGSLELFQTILTAAEKIGLGDALAYLEECVSQKRNSWWEQEGKNLPQSGNPLTDGFALFYEFYLGLSCPNDGIIVEATDEKIVSRWSNRCPTLEACEKLGLDTRVVCRQVYHQPVQALLSKIHPDLQFDRNYSALRPHVPYCEEIISIKITESA
jgi:hypothetical protein